MIEKVSLLDRVIKEIEFMKKMKMDLNIQDSKEALALFLDQNQKNIFQSLKNILCIKEEFNLIKKFRSKKYNHEKIENSVNLAKKFIYSRIEKVIKNLEESFKDLKLADKNLEILKANINKFLDNQVILYKKTKEEIKIPSLQSMVINIINKSTYFKNEREIEKINNLPIELKEKLKI